MDDDFPLKKFAREKRMLTCNRCGKEIKWKYSYADYLKKKQEDENFKNIPLNPDGTPHTCQAKPEIKQEETKFNCPKCGYEITAS